ncbi:MAG: hypothetical protein DHS20C18_40600 [Saprospiraceae bacterium]|nr:MAG: hypothetical protein DHS20C18_40600 [Saprospiraceae bacterium]
MLFLFCFVTQQGFTQISWGIKAGINTSFFKVNDPDRFFFFDSEGTIPGLATGVYALIGRKESPIAMRLELLYSAKGGKTRSFLEPSAFTVSAVYLQYLSLPVLFNYHSGPLYLEFGPELNYLITGRAKFLNSSNKEDVTDLVSNRSELAVAMGMRYELPLFQLGFRYLHGLGKVQELVLTDFNGAPRNAGILKNRTVQFYVSYQVSR